MILQRLDIILCSDAYLLEINKGFLQHDSLTDIITFNLSENTESIIGEIYISTERVAENANKYSVSVCEEFYRVCFHGALHLCGYDDHSESDIIKMRNGERFYIDKFLVPGL